VQRYELITLALVAIFGLAGAWLYEKYKDAGELLAILLVIPPMAFYIAGTLNAKRSRSERERL